MSRATAIATAAALMCLSAVSTAAPDQSVARGAGTFYVSPKGDDGWSGTLASPNAAGTDGPFRTLAKAQASMRASASVKMATLRGGVYSIPTEFLFKSADNGETWIPYQSEAVTIDGAGASHIVMKGVSRLTVEGLIFSKMGLNGAPYPYQIVGFKLDYLVLRWNRFDSCRNTCFAGVRVTNSLIDSNVIDGQSPGNPPGDTGHCFLALTLTNGSSHNRVTHNLITNAQGGGVGIGSGVPDSPNNDNRIGSNLLRNIATNVVDCGALYSLDRTHSATGNRFVDNLLLNVGGAGNPNSQTKAIYIDDLSSNVLVARNVCHDGCGEYALQIHSGDHNRIVNNIFDLSGGSLLGLYQDEPWPVGVPGGPAQGGYASPWMADNVFEGNIVYGKDTLPAPLWQTSLHDPHMLNLESKDNLFFAPNASGSNIGPQMDRTAVYADPGFANAGSGNFAVAPDSPAVTKIHFPSLATNQGPLPRPVNFSASP